jgi:hypothetical protein
MTNTDIITKFLNGAIAGTIRRTNSYTGGNHTPLFIEGATLFSYGHHYELAKRMPDGSVWVNNTRYSATTSKHASLVRSLAIRKGITLA